MTKSLRWIMMVLRQRWLNRSRSCRCWRFVTNDFELYRLQLWCWLHVTYLYMNTWNRHRMFITHIGIPKHKKLYEIGSGTKLYYLFEFKGFSTSGERGTIFLCWLFHLPQTTWGPHCKLLAWLQWASESQPSSSDAKTQLPDFFQIPKILRARFRCMTSFTSPGHIFLSGIFILTSLNDTSSPHAHEHLRSCST